MLWACSLTFHSVQTLDDQCGLTEFKLTFYNVVLLLAKSDMIKCLGTAS